METATLTKKIEQLPEASKQKVEALVNELLQEAQSVNPEKKERQFGAMKGLFGKLPDDFNEPLEDFKDYM